MKKLRPVFLTFYDRRCIGVRTLMAIGRRHGIESFFIDFKETKSAQYQCFKNGFAFRVLQQPISDIEIETALDLIGTLDANLLCISTRSFGLDIAQKFVWRFREKFSYPVLAGGWGPSLEPEKALRWADYVCFGEGEKVWEDICQKGLQIDTKNIIYKIGNRYIINNPCHEVLTPDELNNLPFSDWSNSYQISANHVTRQDTPDQEQHYNQFASRGCPLTCSYCMSGLHKKMYKGKGIKCPKYRVISVSRVLAEFKHAKETWQVNNLLFQDEIIPWQADWIEEFIDRYPGEIGLPFFARPYLGFHSHSVIEKLCDIGMYESQVGIQSGSERIARIYNRPISKSATRKMAHVFQDKNIKSVYTLISHNPYEQEDDLIKTLKYLWSLPYANITIFELVLFPGTPLKNKIDEEKPKPMPRYLSDWYCFIYCMAALDFKRRWLSKIIWKLGLFKKHPEVLIKLYEKKYQHLKVAQKLRHDKGYCKEREGEK